MHDLMTLVFAALAAGCSGSPCLADSASTPQDPSSRSAQMSRPQRTFTLSDESSVSGLMAAAPQGRPQISGFDILKANATSATSSVQDLSNRSAQMARPQRTFTLSDESSVSGLMAAAPQRGLQISGFDILKASATSATSSVQDLSNRSAQMARPQTPPWPSFDETAGSGLMHMRPQSSPLGSGFDIIKPNQQTSQPSKFDLSSRVGLAREEVLPK